ncbi:MAG TPA: NAD(P)-binding domain-containing protein [Gaiellaceae bacterium]
MKIAVLGGTGTFGRALAARFHDLGHEVAIGSRDPERAQQQAAVIGVGGGANADVAADAEFVVLSTASGAAIDTARELKSAIGATPVLCVASDLRFTKEGVLPGRSQGSVAEDVAALLDGPVASGYQSLSAAHLAHPERLDQDVLVCGDEPAAKDPALELGAQLVSGRAIDAGPLANSRALEGMTAVILHVNRRYRVVAGLRLTGLP